MKLYCERCEKETIPIWNERSVLDCIQDDEYGRTKYASDYQIICSECNDIITNWSLGR